MGCVNANGNVRSDQDALTITLDTRIDLTSGVDSVAISWRDPTGVTGEWVGAVEDTTKISYTLLQGQYLSPKGSWSFKALVNFSDGTKASGSTVKELVYGTWD